MQCAAHLVECLLGSFLPELRGRLRAQRLDLSGGAEQLSTVPLKWAAHVVASCVEAEISLPEVSSTAARERGQAVAVTGCTCVRRRAGRGVGRETAFAVARRGSAAEFVRVQPGTPEHAESSGGYLPRTPSVSQPRRTLWSPPKSSSRRQPLQKCSMIE
eukprot:scaffold1302_cov114-Isochrysis_galbana.AAC.11